MDATTDRDSAGKFTKGNTASRGHKTPNASRTQLLHNALIQAVGPRDIRAITKVLIKMAKGGDIQAIKEVYDRALGKAVLAEIEQPSDAPRAVRYSLQPPTESEQQSPASPGTSPAAKPKCSLFGGD